MARRRSEGSATANLDSLLDTMTNVVGILIIVLIVSQLNVTQAVKRIRKDLKPVSETQMAALEKESDTVAKQIEMLKETPADDISPDDLEKLKAEVAKLQVMAVDAEKKRSEKDKLDKSLTLKQKELKDMETALAAQRDQVVGMESETAGLDLEKMPAKRVRLPDPRDPYEDASEVLFYCKGDRVMRIDHPGLLKKTLAALKAEKSIVFSMQGKTPVYEREKTKAFIEKKNISDTDAKVKILNFPDRGWGQLVIEPKLESGGESIKAAADPYSIFRKHLKRARSDRNYIFFIVHNDAFETYLLARRIAEEEFVPIGWNPTTATEIRKSLPGIRFEHTPPPPAKTPGKPAPPNPKRKKPPLLD